MIRLSFGDKGGERMRSRLWAIGTGTTARESYLSIADQGLLSLTNFLSSFALARFTNKVEFGSFMLAFSAMIVFTEIQQCLITGPMAYLGPAKDDQEFRTYNSSLLIGQLGLSGAMVLLAVATFLVLGLFAPTRKLVGPFQGMTLALLFVQMQFFFRRIMFVRLQLVRVFVADLVYCLLRFGGIGFLLWHEFRVSKGWLNGQYLFTVQAIAALIASGFALFMVSRDLAGFRMLRRHFRENWDFGRWHLGSLAGKKLSAPINNFIVASFAGPVGTAALEAPRLLMAPLQVVQIAGGSFMGPKSSHKYAREGREGLLRFSTTMTVFWGLLFLGYTLLILAAPGLWLQLLFGGKYAGSEPVVVLWGLTYLLLGLEIMPGVVLNAIRRPDLSMYLSLLSGAALVGTSLVLSYSLGAVGAATGRLAGEVVFLIPAVLIGYRMLSGRRPIDKPVKRPGSRPLEPSGPKALEHEESGAGAAKP